MTSALFDACTMCSRPVHEGSAAGPVSVAEKPLLKAAPDDTLSGGLPDLAVTRTVVVLNNGDEWAFVVA